MSGPVPPVLVAALALAMAPLPSPPRTPEVTLAVSGDVPTPLTLGADELRRLPRLTVRTEARHDEPGAEYEGVPLFEILKAAGVPFGEGLRGPVLASYLVVEAADGYRAVFALPELDPASTDRVVLLADRRDGMPLGPHEGPLRVIIPDEKRHARWVRQVIALRVNPS